VYRLSVIIADFYMSAIANSQDGQRTYTEAIYEHRIIDDGVDSIFFFPRG
jgi:hypothetical protein